MTAATLSLMLVLIYVPILLSFNATTIEEMAWKHQQDQPPITREENPRYTAPWWCREWVRDAAAKNGLDQAIFTRLLFEESGWYPLAKNVNADGSVDRGVPQLNFRYFPAMSTKAAIYTAARHFAWALRYAGTYRGAIYVWNAGWTRLHTPPARSVKLAREVMQ